MANVYVYSSAAGAGTGADWANAYTTLVAAMTGKAAGDIFYVAHDHAESQATALTIPIVGTEAAPIRIYCVNRAGSVPPVAADLRTTATVTVTGAVNISFQGVGIATGMQFIAGSSTNNAQITASGAAGGNWKFVNCALRLAGNNASSRILLSNNVNATCTTLENTTVQFANVAQRIQSAYKVVWKNTPSAIVGASLPTELLGGGVGQFFLEGVDLSALGANAIVRAGDNCSNVTLKDCKLHASSTVVTANPTAGSGGPDIQLIRCDSGDTNYRTERYNYMGTQTTETTIVRSGGASDGTTPVSWKIVTTANSEWELPFESLPISIWNETIGTPITVTIQGIWGGGAVPNNDDIWIDVEYLGTSGFPLASKATSTKATGLTTASAIPAGSGTWGGSTTKFAMSASFTPQEKGPITIYVRAALVSATFYIDPKPLIS